MKYSILKMTMLGLFAVAVAAVRAQDATNLPSVSESPSAPVTTAPVVPTPVKKAKKSAALTFAAKVVTIDTNAMTLTVGKRTFDITSETIVTKDGKPAILDDGEVGETSTGAYKKNADGKLSATTVNFSTKTATTKKKKKAPSEGTDDTTNNVAPAMTN